MHQLKGMIDSNAILGHTLALISLYHFLCFSVIHWSELRNLWGCHHQIPLCSTPTKQMKAKKPLLSGVVFRSNICKVLARVDVGMEERSRSS